MWLGRNIGELIPIPPRFIDAFTNKGVLAAAYRSTLETSGWFASFQRKYGTLQDLPRLLLRLEVKAPTTSSVTNCL